MARKRTRSKRKTRSTRRPRVAARYRKFKSRTRMAFGRFRRSFRRPRFNSFRSSRRRSYGGGRRRSGGFSRRLPFLGIRIPGMFIWLAIIGGGIYFFKDALQPLINKFKKTA